eukprot:RCo013306
MFVLGYDKVLLSKPPREEPQGGTPARSTPAGAGGAAGTSSTSAAPTALLGTHPLEGDGLALSALFAALWKKTRDFKGCGVRVPDTVVFDGMLPRAWYTFDERNMELKKKAFRELSIPSIRKEFSVPMPRVPIPGGPGFEARVDLAELTSPPAAVGVGTTMTPAASIRDRSVGVEQQQQQQLLWCGEQPVSPDALVSASRRRRR